MVEHCTCLMHERLQGWRSMHYVAHWLSHPGPVQAPVRPLVLVPAPAPPQPTKTLQEAHAGLVAGPMTCFIILLLVQLIGIKFIEQYLLSEGKQGSKTKRETKLSKIKNHQAHDSTINKELAK